MICDAFDPCSIPPFTDLSLLSFHIPYHIGKAFKGAVCRILTLLKHKNTIICLQTFRKHVKLTYLFI